MIHEHKEINKPRTIKLTLPITDGREEKTLTQHVQSFKEHHPSDVFFLSLMNNSYWDLKKKSIT